MYINFTSTHLDTLCKLKDIAEKHNCIISFGVQSTNDEDELHGEVLENIISPNILNILEQLYEESELSRLKFGFDQVWFALKENVDDRTTIHELSYTEYYQHFDVKQYDALYLQSNDENDKIVEELQDFALNESVNGDVDNPEFIFNTSETVIQGFGLNHVKDDRVYRYGMALKYFSDLVCDYLKEPRIIATYE